jgi:hypothetical protein
VSSVPASGGSGFLPGQSLTGGDGLLRITPY